MVQEFEMRKSAAQHKRAFVTKTGVLDPVKMNNYKTSEDIFRRLTVVPDGKNHGFVMVLDLSGSMCTQLFNVISQTILMTQFCRQINVPFRVYGFTDYLSFDHDVDQEPERIGGHIIPDQRLRMLEIFNEKMSKQQVATVGGELLLSAYVRDYNTFDFKPYTEALGFVTRQDIYYHIRPKLTGLFDLGGTPLDSSLLVMTAESLKFRKEHRLDVLNTLFLTDGASHPCTKIEVHDAYGENRFLEQEFRPGRYRGRDAGEYKRVLRVRCEYNHKTYSTTMAPGRARDINSTELLMKMYNDVTGSNTIGYYILTGPRGHSASVVNHLRGGFMRSEDWSPMWKEMLKGTPGSIEVAGYHKMYVLSAKSLSNSQEESLEHAEVGMTKSKLRNLFKKGGISTKKHRRFLSEIAEAVS
jgi:hypothetical protein